MNQAARRAARSRRPMVLFALACIAGGCSSQSIGKADDRGSGAQDVAVAPVRGIPAFDGAVGFGAASRGGRGGEIIAVTTLADAGPGSLRACIEAANPRVCVFRVSGVIRFTARPPMIRHPYITIAGQTAPGGGITLAHAGGADGRTPLVVKGTHDVVIRHLRVRNDRLGEERGSEDSITIESSRQVIVDHVSASWARDELVNGYADNDYITISDSIFAFGVPPHDKCALLGSDPTGPQHFSFIGNLCAHSGDRNPDINFPPGSCVEVLNNVLYNAQAEFAEVWESYGGTPVAIAGNVFKAGPNTHAETIGIARQMIGSKGPSSLYLADNRFDGAFVHLPSEARALERATPPCPLTMRPLPAGEAWSRVLAGAGAWPRDTLDAMVVADVRRGTGRIVREPGTIPDAAAGPPYPDRDGDGMDDSWEAAHGADPTKADPWLDGDGDGKANLDAFLDELARKAMA